MRDTTVLPSVLDVIGNTPVVELSRLTKDIDGRIVAKLDYLNPGFSKKDRIALQMIEDAESEGRLEPGQTVVELTSGNTGTGLAIACAVKGYRFVAVMSRGNSEERARMMRALGAEVVLVDQLPGGVPGRVSGGDLAIVEQETRKIAAKRNAFRADQFSLEGNFRAHYLHTGPEFLRQTDGEIDLFCDFAGSTGTFAGCAAAFKEHSPDIRCFIAEPHGAAVISGENAENPGHPIQGGGYSMTLDELKFLNCDHIDGFVKVTGDEAKLNAHRLAKEEGIFAGFSSGANIAAALKLLGGSFSGKTAAVVINDSGLKYLSADLWD